MPIGQWRTDEDIDRMLNEAYSDSPLCHRLGFELPPPLPWYQRKWLHFKQRLWQIGRWLRRGPFAEDEWDD